MPRSRPTAADRADAVRRAEKLLTGRGRSLEACLLLLGDDLPPGEREIAKNALCEASAILCDAGQRIMNPLPPLGEDS